MAHKPVLVAVTSTNEPYLYDAPNVLSLPLEAEFRFRYHERWVEQGLRNLAKASHDSLKGARLILVFHDEVKGHLIALREATVVRAEILGPVTYLRFKVGKFCNPRSGANETNEALLSRSTELCRRLLGLESAIEPAKHLPEGFYLRRAVGGGEPERSTADTPDAWWGVVSLLESVTAVATLPFFHVLGLASENGEPQRWTGLVQGRRYRLRVLEWAFRKANEPFAHVNCSCSPDLLVLEAASNVIVGQYDVVDFDFVATKLGKGQLSIALTKVGPANGEAEAKWNQSFHTAIPIKVSPSRWQQVGRFLVALAGVILYLWVGPLVGQKWGGSSQNAVQGLGLLLFVLGMGSLGEKAVTASKDVREFAKKPGE